jgi:hypothetical protein
MNIVTPIPTAIVFSNANVNTESARRDNVLRETIPQTSNTENSEAKSALGSESDKVRTPSQQPAPLVYERPQSNPNASSQGLGSDTLPDNAEDESAGKESAEEQQKQQQQLSEQQEIESLKQRDQEVRAHEQAHAAVGGQYAGSPQYEFQTGPDGQRYAVGGEVSIDIGEEPTAEQTLRKMQQVKAAALAPAEPSPQDLRVATEATQKAFEARNEITERRRDELAEVRREAQGDERSDVGEPEVPDLDDIIDAVDISIPTRSLDKSELGDGEFVNQQRTELRQDKSILNRIDVIQNTYQSIAKPLDIGLSLSV